MTTTAKRRTGTGAAGKAKPVTKAKVVARATHAKAARAARGAKKTPARTGPADEFSAQGGSFPLTRRGADHSHAHHAAEELSWADFDASVQALARDAQKRFKPEAVVGLAHGGVFVGGAVASALKLEFFPVRLSPRSRDSGARATLGIGTHMPAELKGRRVLVVDDVAASGDALEQARRLARAAGAKQVSTAALVKRPDGYAPDLCTRTTKAFIVFPWDYRDVVDGGPMDPGQVDPDTAGA